MYKGSPCRPGGSYIGFQWIERMLNPWAIQVVRHPGVKLQVGPVHGIGREEPPSLSVVDKRGIEQTPISDEDSLLLPTESGFVETVETHFAEFMRFRDTVQPVLVPEEVRIGQMAREIGR
jgi:hypothetical protein